MGRYAMTQDQSQLPSVCTEKSLNVVSQKRLSDVVGRVLIEMEAAYAPQLKGAAMTPAQYALWADYLHREPDADVVAAWSVIKGRCERFPTLAEFGEALAEHRARPPEYRPPSDV